MSSPTLLGASGHDTDSGQDYIGTYYSNVGLGRCPMITGGFTTASSVNQTIPVAGTVSYLSWGLDETTFDASLTLALNVNSSASTLAISIPEMTSGFMTDSTHSVSVSSGDALNFAATVGTTEAIDYVGSFFCVSARFDADSAGPIASVQLLVTVGPSQFIPTTTLEFANFQGILGTGNIDTHESHHQFLCLAAGTWQNMTCYIDSNPFNKKTMVYNRITAASGSMSFPISANTSGQFEDATDTDSVSVDDLLNYGLQAVENGNGEGFSMDWIGAQFITTESALRMIGGSTDPPTLLSIE